ncbi:MAG: 23S rRNA (uracil(1939)-C(5))-methyltransferase RlmD [Firmicutes bacterium]|nr:23S rRNA (uracil(1939)-C(5))-methyltransferase RlmD [Bacillota bacterium]
MGKKEKPPVATGEIIQLQIDSLNHNGEGVGRISGYAVFVPGALPGELVQAKVISLQKNYCRALIESVTQTSPERLEPICDQYTACGGCQLLHLAYGEQLRLKQKTVEDALWRIGGLQIPVRPTIGMDEPWHYRNKAQVPVAVQNGEILAGFYEKRSHNIVNLKRCHLQHPDNDQVAHAVRRILGELKIPAYQENTHTGLVRHILARTSFSTGNILAVIITNGRTFPRKEEFVAGLRRAVPNITGIVQNINTRKGNTILGPEEIILWGQPWLMETLDGLQFIISPRSFFQVNPLQTEVLYRKAVEYAALTGSETVFDLYCGSGTISLFLARGACRVIGVESVEAAIKDARENAALNGITNVEFHAGPAEKIVPTLLKEGEKADVVVVDPPRKGCDAALLDTMAKMQPQRIVYVSCNPATLARDLKILHQKGYIPLEAQPVDMFPHTFHVECVVLITRNI